MFKDNLLINFFCELACDSEGRTIRNILGFNDKNIEDTHNFIQWIFPTYTESKYNPDAPQITRNFKILFQDNAIAKDNFCKTCRMFLNFIGMECCENSKNISIKENAKMFYERPPSTLFRITRVLNSLNQVGNVYCSKSLFSLLSKINEIHCDKIPQKSFMFWQETQH